MHTRSRWTAVLACTLGTTVAFSGAVPASAASVPGSRAELPAAAGAAPEDTGEERGSWDVTTVAPDRYMVSWTSPSKFPVTDARPEIVTEGVLAGPPTLDADGRTVEVTIESPTAPDIADYDVVMSGQVLDSTVDEPTTPELEPYRKVAKAAELPIADDPGVAGTHETETSDYRLPAVKLPDIPEKAEMLGHVVQPTDADENSPLVLFLHGRHSPCYVPKAGARRGSVVENAAPGNWKCRGKSIPIPSYLGYDYVQQLLASQGYVTVSISANAINDLDFEAPDGGAAARAALIRAHLTAWVGFVADDTRSADLTNVVLVGHSRGGEGADRAVLDRRTDAPYDIAGQVLLGPTDFGFQAAPSTPTVTVLPYCDGDVSDLQGQNFTDAARDLTDEVAFHSSVLVMGANHNFFNTEWTPGLSAAPSNDDWWSGQAGATKMCGRQHPMRLSKQGQQDVGSAYIAGAVQLFADNDQSVLPMFDGSAVSVPSAQNADVRSHAIGGGLETRRPAVDAGLAPSATATSRLCTGLADGFGSQLCEREVSSARTPHWPSRFYAGITLRRAWETSWTAVGQESGLALDDPWDLSAMASVDLRTIVQPGHGPATLSVKLTDGNGDSAVVVPEGGGQVAPLPGGSYSLAKRWAQDLRVPLAGVAGVDLSDIVTVGLVAGNAAGRVWVLDLTAHPTAALPAPPVDSLPTISVGNVTQKEGDGPGQATLKIPYTVAGGALASDATVRMVPSDGLFETSGKPKLMVIPAGATSGTIDVAYRPNSIDDYRRIRRGVAIFPVAGIATNHYLGGATVLDDDPAPKMTIKPQRKRIREGATARWIVTLSAPTGYFFAALAKPVRGPGKGKRLTVGDVPAKFRKEWLPGDTPLSRPLYKSDLLLFGGLREGRTRFVVSLPTRISKKDQGPRSITLRFRPSDPVRHRKLTHRIVVID
jgi:hypothetical protein